MEYDSGMPHVLEKWVGGSLLGMALFCHTAVAQGTNGVKSGGLSEAAYVWQRDWNDGVHTAVSEYGAAFENLVALAAEVSWDHGQPQVTHAAVDYRVLAAAKTRAGLALRIGLYAGPPGQPVKALSELAASLVAEAKSKGLTPGELQIDYDCAESKLEGYRGWVMAIKSAVAPVPVAITALPSWLKQPDFRRLIGAADGYVLQVHSLERPTGIDAPFTLCDPAVARAVVEEAGKFGVPFRVALPTYGYTLAFSAEGRFIGLSAEGPAKSWPADVKLREVRSDPLVMADLVRGWNEERPMAMQGVIWYRLPMEDDILNWRWPTLAAIVAGRSPHESMRAESRRVEPGLIEISLVNDGEFDISSRPAVEVRWPDDRLTAGDGLRGFELVEVDASTARLQAKSRTYRLPAGARQVIGWLRLNKNGEVQLELKKL
jgi:Protein of unknown function (DUF3142)